MGSVISVHVGVGQRCRALDVESSAALPTISTRVTFQRGDGGKFMGDCVGAAGKQSKSYTKYLVSQFP